MLNPEYHSIRGLQVQHDKLTGSSSVGRVRALGAWGRRFESCLPDQGKVYIVDFFESENDYVTKTTEEMLKSVYFWVENFLL